MINVSIFSLLNINEKYQILADRFREALPIQYLSFLERFRLGDNTFKLKFVKTKNWEKCPLTCIAYENKYLSYEYKNYVIRFFSRDEIFQEIEKYIKQVEEYHKKGFILIGSFDISDAILLGVAEDNRDEIWSWNGDWEFEREEFVKLEGSIFDFIENCKEEVIEFNIKEEGITLNDLYCNWGEDLWRVREDNTI